jgi:hypothetical protein
MTEEEWLTCDRPPRMLYELSASMSDRQLRLFACACCRAAGHFVDATKLDEALSLIERFVDGKVKDRARIQAGKVTFDDLPGLRAEVASCVGAEVRHAAVKTIRRGATSIGESAAAAFGWTDHGHFYERKSGEQAKQAVLLRDISGNPFRPVALEPAWLTSDVRAGSRDLRRAGVRPDADSGRRPPRRRVR